MTAWVKYDQSLEWKGTLRGVGEVHAWILPRPDYCDRGHWCWGYTSQGGMSGVEGSYYFLSAQSAIEEIELMMVRACQHFNEEKTDPSAQAKDVLSKLWVNHNDVYHRIMGTEDAAVMLTLTKDHDETGPVWCLDCSGIEYMDGGDQFPRIYRSLQTATKEADRFVEWRINKKRFENTTDILNAFESEPPQWAQGQSLQLYLGDNIAPTMSQLKMY